MTAGTVSSSLAELLASRATERGAGLVTATRGKLRRLFCLDGGCVVYAVSNVLEEQFAERLVADDLLSAAERSAIQREATRSKRKFAAIVRESGRLSDAAMARVMGAQIRKAIADCLGWRDGRFRFEPGKPDLADEVLAAVPIAELVLNHVAIHPPGLDAVRVRIGLPDLTVRVAKEIAHALDRVQRTPSLDHVLERAASPIAVGDLCRDAPEGVEQAYRAIYGLLLLRVLRRADTVSGAAAAERASDGGTASREEIEGWLSKATTANHYEILGVAPTADLDEIRAAYYRHARRLHPDRLRSGPHADLVPKVEEFFGKVTEAHNTLQSPERRREYDRALREFAGRTRADDTADRASLARQNFVRAMGALERRRLSEALSFLENAVRLDDRNAEYRRELGVLLTGNVRRRSDAEGHLRAALELDPSLPESYVALAELLIRTDREDEAIGALREALRWDADHEPARKRLAELGAAPDGSKTGGGLFGR